MEVQPNEVTILSDTALRGEDLDEERAMEAERLAQEAMKNSSSDVDTAKAKSELLQAAAQLRLIKKLKSKAKNKEVAVCSLQLFCAGKSTRMKANKSKLLFDIVVNQL